MIGIIWQEARDKRDKFVQDLDLSHGCEIMEIKVSTDPEECEKQVERFFCAHQFENIYFIDGVYSAQTINYLMSRLRF